MPGGRDEGARRAPGRGSVRRVQPIEPNRTEPPGFAPERSRPDDAGDGGDDRGERPEAAATADPDAIGLDAGDADSIDLDAVERDLDAVERALEQLADGTYWSQDDQRGAPTATAPDISARAEAGTGRHLDDQPGTPA